MDFSLCFKLSKDIRLSGSYKKGYCSRQRGFFLAVGLVLRNSLVVSSLIGYCNNLNILKLIGNNGFALFLIVTSDNRNNITGNELAGKTACKGGDCNGDCSLFACKPVEVCVFACGNIAYLC